MKPETKAARIAAMLGIEVPKPPTANEVRYSEGVSREAEATIAYFEAPARFINRLCRICEREFAVNRANISCCSDHCRRELLASLGIEDWDPNQRTPEDRWNSHTGGLEPLSVVPEALDRVKELLPQTDVIAG